MNHQRPQGSPESARNPTEQTHLKTPGLDHQVSAVLPDGRLVEMVLTPQGAAAYALWENGGWRLVNSIANGREERLVPYSAKNNLFRTRSVLLPSEPLEYGSDEELIASIRAYIHRYLDVSPLFETIATYYVLFTWLYDRFNELPYLRVRGDPGSGKTRFLVTVGSVCYKPIFASGASTVSPIFRILHGIRGTLIIDEADFQLSDEKAEIVKILNNGIGREFPVLRSEPSGRQEYSPHAFEVFGPKLVATRGLFQDRALESRCITEAMGVTPPRRDIPINMPDVQRREALELRNKLLLFRFRNFSACGIEEGLADRAIEARLAQMFVPLLSVIKDEDVREQMRTLARHSNREMMTDRSMDTEAKVLEAIKEVLSRPEGASLAVKDITQAFTDRYGTEYMRPITAKWIGTIIRTKLNIQTQRLSGLFSIPLTEMPKIRRLWERYGITAEESPSSDEPAAAP